jgi:hypothetical protein
MRPGAAGDGGGGVGAVHSVRASRWVGPSLTDVPHHACQFTTARSTQLGVAREQGACTGSLPPALSRSAAAHPPRCCLRCSERVPAQGPRHQQPPGLWLRGVQVGRGRRLRAQQQPCPRPRRRALSRHPSPACMHQGTTRAAGRSRISRQLPPGPVRTSCLSSTALAPASCLRTCPPLLLLPAALPAVHQGAEHGQAVRQAHPRQQGVHRQERKRRESCGLRSSPCAAPAGPAQHSCPVGGSLQRAAPALQPMPIPPRVLPPHCCRSAPTCSLAT